ncbi:STAS domain-containing protein [Rubinisphaera margarita]|uniref:STAS domain-containing protein n=1 Tax=Rubinisphaera margarita TaxID=2909586 RepID=UPI001EE8B85D|nr:STAS domain-containing protein [Rubinisphaera margarita]MCG6154416.1 STAS domain-containing protein [Rubinisphaera margarita]
MNQPIRYTISRENDVLILHFSEQTRFDSTDFRQVLQNDLNDGDNAKCQHVIIDCSGMKYTNSLFVEAVLRIAAEMKKRDGSFCLCGLEPFVRDLVHVTQLDHRWTIYDDRAAAMAALEKASS